MKVNDGEKLIAAVSVLRSDEEEAPAEGEEQVDEPLTGPQSEESAE